MNTLYKILNEGLLLKANGEPIKTRKGIRERLRKFGFSPDTVNEQGFRVYSVSDQDIININNAALNPDEDLIIQSL